MNKNKRRFCSTVLILAFAVFSSNAQDRLIQGRVFAFKDLPLNAIQINSKKAKTVTYTDSLGIFQISCKKNDLLIFTGHGFQKINYKIRNSDTLDIKMILKEGTKNEQKAFQNGHVGKADLSEALSFFSAYNFYDYPNDNSPFNYKYVRNSHYNNNIYRSSDFINNPNYSFNPSTSYSYYKIKW